MRTADVKKMLRGVTAPRFVPGGVADPAGERVYLPGTRGGIDALDLATGALLWHSDSATLPLLGLNGRLLAAAGGTRVSFFLLGAGDGGVVPFPYESIETPPYADWRLTATRLDGDQLVLSWRLAATGPTLLEEGATRLDLVDGTVTPDTEPTAAVDPGPVAGLTLFRDARAQAVPWAWEGGLAALVSVTGDEIRHLDLYTWRPGKNADRRVFTLVSPLPGAGFLEHHPSPDGDRVYLLFCNDREKEGRPMGSVCQWLVFTVADGSQRMVFDTVPGLQPPLAVVGDRLFYVQFGSIPGKRQLPLRRLQAVDVASREPAWSHVLPQQPAERLVAA